MKRTLQAIYRRLFSTFGPQRWWPGETPFEVAVGAILTQNTAWTNAARAIARLKEENLLHAGRLGKVPEKRLALLIRSSGYFNQKAKRLRTFARYLLTRYGGRMGRMKEVPLAPLREELLGLSGIGPETADSILLYALDKPAFVVDAYTRRILARHSLISWEASYEEIQGLFMSHLPAETSLFNEYHALLVALGKGLCQAHPKCHLCPLRDLGRLRLETSPAKIRP
ncbi:MAG: endonuclease III domain-containing protein [Candidatus Omnitrophica bacterium]|nr:endonuclease III domain-containing protein [Candidatus Omnitrophota bacterium]